MSQILNETLLSVTEVRKTIIPLSNGKPVAPSTVSRWMAIGKYGVTLEFVMVGCTKKTSREAIHRFFQAITKKEKRRLAVA